ncbi:MAG: hypothetical protein V3R86_04610 [Candidatus Hydrothermarchaeaceae archaeon]
MNLNFLKEEKAQGAIEYILLAGGVIFTAVMISFVFISMGEGVARQLNESSLGVVADMTSVIDNTNF